MSDSNITIVGAGMIGLLMARRIKEKNANVQITIIEKNDDVGGLYRTFDKGSHGYFDYGIHTFYESANQHTNDFLWNLLPKEDWITLNGNKRDLTASLHFGKFNAPSPFPDLRDYEDSTALIAALKEHARAASLKNPIQTDTMTAYDASVHRVGEMITERCVRPIIEANMHQKLEDSHSFALVFWPVSRFIIADEKETLAMMESDPALAKVIAYPEQRNLPKAYQPNFSGFYPQKYGWQFLVKKIAKELQEDGVKFLTSTTIEGINYKNSEVYSTHVTAKETFQEIPCDDFIWTGNLVTLHKLIGLDNLPPMDRPNKSAITLFLVKKYGARVVDTYSSVAFDPGYSTYRFSFPSNWCPDATRNGLFPIMAEMMLPFDQINKHDWAEIARDELIRSNAIDDENDIIFTDFALLEEGFPNPTMKNHIALSSIRQQLAALGLSNLHLQGLGSHPDGFFFNDLVVASIDKSDTLVVS